MAKKQTSSSKTASLFDIRLKNDHDVLVLKGAEHEAASALLSGKIVLSINEPISIKKLTIRLYSTLRLHWVDNVQTTKGTFQRPSRFEKKVYEYNWDPNEINKYLNDLYENSSAPNNSSNAIGSLSRNHSSTSLKNLGHSIRSKSSGNLTHLSSLTSSSTNLSNLSSGSTSNLSNAKNNHVLIQGNYEIPFSAVLPGTMPESVEGLPGGSVVYKIEAIIDRGKFHNSMVTKKHVRVIRTITTDAVELSETVAVDNTWPKKVEYSLSVPTKAIAIGSGTPISFMLVPLLKGLKLGDIKVSLVEYYSYVGYIPPPNNAERLVCEKVIPKPNEDDTNFQMDKWEVSTFLKVPPTLSKCTQDCDIQTHLKVRHKLKFVIGLINPDNHVSELRASLPVQLFISPFVTISARYDEQVSDPSNSNSNDLSRKASSVELQHLSNENSNEENRENEELLFTNDPHSASHSSLNQLGVNSGTTSPNGEIRSNANSFTSFTGMVAPPLYEKHIYDRLWSDISPVESPSNSGSATPRMYSSNSNNRNDVQNQFSMSPIDSVQLNENLRQLSIQRLQQESADNNSGHITPRDRATFDLDGEQSHTPSNNTSNNNNNDMSDGDYFSRGRPILNHTGSSDGSGANYSHSWSNNMDMPLPTPGALNSPPTHLSRATSESNVHFNPKSLSRVPTYSQAMRSEAQDEVLSPAYEPPLPGSNVNLNEVNKHFEEIRGVGNYQHNPNFNNLSRNKSFLSRGSSSANLRNLSSSRNSSNNSSPSNSRNVSYTNLSSMNNLSALNNPSTLSRTPSKSEQLSFSSSNSGTPSNVNTPTPIIHVGTNGNTGSGITPLSTSPNAHKTHDIPPHLLHLHLHLHSASSIRQPSRSAADRNAAVLGNTGPIKSSSSLSLHNLHFMNKKKEKK